MHPAAPEVTLSGLHLVNASDTTLSVTWSASYPKCYSFTVSHSTQDGSINVTQPADSDTSHTLTSLQPDTSYRIEVEVVRKGDRADGQMRRIMGNFPTAIASERERMVGLLNSQGCMSEVMGVRALLSTQCDALVVINGWWSVSKYDF